MLKVGKVYLPVVDDTIPDEVNSKHQDGVGRVEQQVEEEVRQPEGSGRNARHKL